jgi:hypothetical protein
MHAQGHSTHCPEVSFEEIIHWFPGSAFRDHFRFADELNTICGQANSAAIERPVRHNSTPRDRRGASC